MARPSGAVDQQNIEPAIGIVIDEGATRPQRLGRYLAPNAPLLWWKSIPAAAVTSVK